MSTVLRSVGPLRVEPRQPTSEDSQASSTSLSTPRRIAHSRPEHRLFFDIENRPLTYWAPDRPTADITAIAWAVDGGDVEVALQTKRDSSRRRMLRRFLDVYRDCDEIVGHNIRRHDLPILNAHLIEAGLPQLEPRMTCDTLKDLPRWKDIPKSLEYLAEWLQLGREKQHMGQRAWRQANRLIRVDEAKTRCVSDVELTRDVYHRLRDLGLLRRPTPWRP